MKHMNRIKEVLEEKGIKQTWLAEKIGKSFSQTNAYVCNRRLRLQPSPTQLGTTLRNRQNSWRGCERIN